MRILIFIFASFFSTLTNAATFINGSISKTYPIGFEETSGVYAKNGFVPFPSRKYMARIVTIGGLSYTGTTLNKDKQINLNRYKSVEASAILSLEKFNKNSGSFKFKLSFTPKKINDHDIMINVRQMNPITFSKWQISKDAMHKDYVIKGKVKYLNGQNKQAIIIENQNKDGINLSLDKNGEIIVSLNQNLPLLIEID